MVLDANFAEGVAAGDGVRVLEETFAEGGEENGEKWRGRSERRPRGCERRGGKGRGRERPPRCKTRKENMHGRYQTYHMGHWTSSANLSRKACCPAGSRSARPSGGRGEGGVGAAALITTALLPAAFFMWPWCCWVELIHCAARARRKCACVVCVCARGEDVVQKAANTSLGDLLRSPSSPPCIIQSAFCLRELRSHSPTHVHLLPFYYYHTGWKRCRPHYNPGCFCCCCFR